MECTHYQVAVGLGVSAIGLLAWWYFRPSEYHRLLAKIPGPTTVPLFGNALQLKSDTVDFFNQVVDYCDVYKDQAVFKLMLGNEPLLVIFEADTAEQVLGSMKNISKSMPYKFLHPWLRTGLLTSTGEKWQSRRKLLTPTFHFKILLDFLDVFNEQSAVLVELLTEKCDKGPFDIFRFVKLCALDVMCESAMGRKMDIMKTDGESDYVKAISGMSSLIMKRFRRPWEWINAVYRLTENGRKHNSYLKILHNFTQQVIDERRKEIEENPELFNEEGGHGPRRKRRRAFLDLLLHMAKEEGFTNLDIREEVDTFMFEGHDTTACAMAWVIQSIGTYPEIQEKLHNEMDEVFGDSDRHCTMDDITNMKYLECVIKESLRMNPSVPWIGRTVEENTEIAGLIVPKGVSLSILISKINRDPKHFTNPDKFDPERFRLDSLADRHPFCYIPFSAGPRNCIGQRFALNEVKCVLSSMLRKFNIEATQTLEEIRPIPDMVLRPTDGIAIKLSRRSTY